MTRPHHLGLSDYLLKIFGGKTYVRQGAVDVQNESEFRDLERFFEAQSLDTSNAVRDNLRDAFKRFQAVQIARPSSKPDPSMVQRGRDAIQSLSQAFFEIDTSHRFFKQAQISDLEQMWQLHWFDDETIPELFKRMDDFARSPQKREYDLVVKQQKDAFVVIAAKLQSLIKDKTDSSGTDLSSRNVMHTSEEIELFEHVQHEYYSLRGSRHFDYVKRVTDFLELKLRAFLYVTSFLLFGSDYVRFMPQEVKNYAYKNLSSRETYSGFTNAYDGFTRPQFRSAFLTGGKLSEHIKATIPVTWPTADWNTFFDLYVEENIATAHQQLASYDAVERPKYLRYCKLAEELTSAMNRLISKIILDSSYIIRSDDADATIGAYAVAFYLKTMKLEKGVDVEIVLRKSDICVRPLNPEAYASVMSSIQGKIASDPLGCVTQDLLDVEYVINNYYVNYEDFVDSLVYASKIDKTVRLTPWFGSSVLIRASDITHHPAE